MKLLIVEDELKIRNALIRGFVDEGYTVEGVEDGEEALNTMSHGKYDCIILDLMLPKVDGISVIKQMRINKDFTPVIMLTAKDSIHDKVFGLEKGADDYLAKPFSFDELLARVKALIRRTTENRDVLQVDNLILDPFKKTVKRGGTEIIIAGKDYAILEYLMRNKGAVVSESQIIRRVWNDDFEINSNVVAAHIKSLRNKIDRSFPDEKQILHTLRGLGYKING